MKHSISSLFNLSRRAARLPKWLWTLALLPLAAGVQAQDPLDQVAASQTKIDYTYVESAGYVELIIPYHYDASGGLNDVWYAEGGEKGIAVLLDEGREEVRLVNFGNLSFTPGGKMPAMTVVDTHGSHLVQDQAGLNAGGGIREMRVKWYFSEYYVGKPLQIKMYVYADKYNDTRPSVQTEHAYDAYTIRGLGGIGEGTQTFAGLRRVTLSVPVNDLPRNVEYRFGPGTWTSYAPGGSHTFTNEYDYYPSQRPATLSLRKKYSDYCTIQAGKTTQLPGYQAINSFSAQYDPAGKVHLSWTLEPGTGNREGGDQFVIQRATNSSFTNAVEVTRVNVNIDQTAAFTYEDDLVSDFIQGNVYYRITRSKTLDTPGWGWNFGMTANVQDVVLEHQRVLSAKVELSENASGRDVAVITWTHNGTDKVWSSGSSFVIVRANATQAYSAQISGIDQSVFASGTYTDESILSCNSYTYELYVQPGNTHFQTYRLTTNGVLPTDIGEFSGSMEASKGYFSDRVELSWSTEGLFDEFSVRRRPYGSNEPFRQVSTVAGSASNNYYSVEDRTCVPGQVYEYQIAGLVNCSGTPLETENPASDIGFRTPTGDIYGRVTYESGQAVEGVSVRAEPSEGGVLSGKSYAFAAGNVLTVNDATLLANGTDSLTVQAWVSVDAEGQVLGKEGMFALSVAGDKAVFTAGGQSVSSTSDWSDYQQSARFVHLTGMMTADTLYIGINGQIEGRVARTAPGVLSDNANPFVMGGGTFAGHIDEVRVWIRAFDAETLAQDYTRYLTGGEAGLEAYYTFDYAVADRFFDTSYTGADYHARHGQVGGATLTADAIPTAEQLGYKGMTGTDGAYSIRAIPYTGNGTSYMIVPSLGIHSFEPEKEVRFINADAQSHTVNFTDKSSFEVSGTVTYQGGTIPVEGVSFYVDGVVVMDDKANVVTTDAQGNFTISVPVGVHEVRAEKQYHVFENEGKITNSDGTDRNYQDRVTGIELTDITTVRYIGRVAGGAVQEAFPVGHSLSTNNLGDGMSVTLTYQNDAYVLANEPRTETLTHFDGEHTNEVAFSQNVITIYPNKETGEFVADVLPERFRVNVAVAGHDDMPGDGGELNLTNAFIEETSVYEYKTMLPDSTTEAHSDTVRYQMMQQFIKRYSPTVGVTQLDDAGQPLPYYGDSTYTVNTADASRSYTVRLYEDGGYTFGMPVYEQLAQKRFGVNVYEEYIYKDEEGNDKEGVQPDHVPTTDARVTFGGDLPFGEQTELEVDSTGYVEYEFQVNDPELTAAVRSISATMVYGDTDNPTSIPWDGFRAVVVGAHLRGTDFITAGPDQILFVLRDPPGSNSYAYLEKGVTVDKTSAYVGNVSNTLSEVISTKAGATVITFAGLGGGTIVSSEVENELGAGVTNAQTLGGSDTKHWLTETTTRFQTSADPAYVGADGDLYVGYSTNTSFGVTDNVVFVPRATYDANPGDYEVYEDITPIEAGTEWVLAHSTGMGISQNFATLFAYPQVHIEQKLIPQIEEFRNNLLHQQSEGLDFQALANQQNSAVYVSKLLPDDPNYGKSNSDEAFGQVENEDVFDGQSYKIYFPDGTENKTDTILLLNQSIDNWIKHIRENEADKVNAELLQNYSLQAGASVEYADSYSYSFTSEVNFSIAIGAELAAKTGMLINSNSGVIFDVTENLTTEHGGVFTTEQEASQAKGFVLEETGTDYLSVDVCLPAGYLADDQYITYEDMMDNPPLSTFIFKTKGGATACPYEAGYTTRYYEPGTVIDEPTVQVEVPEISVEDDFIENVPSGQPAYVTLYIRNNSESQDDNWFNLKMVDGSNPNGAGLVMDAAPIGNGRALLVPAGETLIKTLEVRKGAVMNYDNLQLTLESQCQCDPTDYVADIVDTVAFSVHFTPSATPVNLREPGDNWTYNTQLPTEPVNGIDKHYMQVVLDGFDVNYDNFHRIMLQYKPTSASESEWTTLTSYYNDEEAYNQAVANGQNAEMIDAADGGTITYKWFLDDLQDQRYDLRAVGTSMINNEEVQNLSDVHSGIKDMYTPRLFGSAQPANGILTVNDEVRLNFNEAIADGYLTQNNFSVTGIRNGAQTDHSVAVRLDGVNDYLSTEFSRNWSDKDITVEMWVLPDAPQDAVLFSHGNVNTALELRLLADNRLQVQVGTQVVTSPQAVPFEQGTWAYVAMVLDQGQGTLTVYYNDASYIDGAEVEAYTGEGRYFFGASVNGGGHYAGQMHNARIWHKVVPWARLLADRLTLLSGAESNLYAYYPMDEGKGAVLYDKARGANLETNGSEWALPEGRAVAFNGQDQYLRLSTGSSAVIDSSMDYTLEFWFKGEAGQADATLVSNGRGDGQDMSTTGDPSPSLNLLSVGFEAGVLTIQNNGAKVQVDGDWLDNDWHHFALAVSRTTGRGQVMLDGQMRTYFESQDFGGLSAAYLYLGARAWYAPGNAGTLHVDNFFRGEMDDFRLWELYKSETLVADGNNTRLDGMEKGLLAYYPFEYYEEWQGTPELHYTLADQRVQDESGTPVPDAEEIGGSLETATTAPVKDKGPEVDLTYDFVVNNDALIITLTEPVDRIENTTVTFTVDGVRDLNGNEMVSPITWSAYIDRNQLQWDETRVSLEKAVYEPGDFTVRALNLGGSVQHFTLENMPAWLDADPASGTIDPAGYVDIEFAINEGLNVGTYNEVIYLRGDNNVLEPLELDLTVRGEEPDWTVDPADYRYSMSVIGQIRINNIFSSDADDKLAAFDGGRCVGVGNSTYDRTHDLWYVFLTVYGNDKQAAADGLQFRIWDASTGKVYGAMPDEPLSFRNDAIYGSDAPVVFDGRELFFQNISLVAGWNWISFNLTNADLADVNATLDNGQWTADDVVKDEDNFDSYSAAQGRWTGLLSAHGGFDNTSLYLLRSSAVQVLSVSGTVISPDTVPLTVLGGRWNYIGYLPEANYTVAEALAGYEAREGDIIKSQGSFAVYSDNGWIGNLTYLEANKGYMLYRDAEPGDDVQFTYPATQGTLGSRTRQAAKPDDAYVNTAYAGNMGIVATVQGAEDGDRIVARVDGEVRGVAVFVPGGAAGWYFLTVAGDEADRAVTFELERDGEVVAQASQQAVFHRDAVLGSLDEPYVIDFQGAAGQANMFPSPFTDRLHVQVDVPADGARVEITVFNMTGQAVAHHSEVTAAGLYHWQWDGCSAAGASCPAGTYLVRIDLGGDTFTHKVEKKR